MTSTLTRTFPFRAAIVCAFACTCAHVVAQSTSLQIIPAPKQVYTSEAGFGIGRDAHIMLADGKSVDDRFAAQDFVDDVKQAAGVNLKFGRGGSRGEILIGLIDLPKVRQALKPTGIDLSQKLTDEGYFLTVSENQVVVAGKTATGTFYGLQTLKQMVRGEGASAFIPGVKIVDWPTMRWRAVSDDISRGPVPTVDYIKRQIRAAAFFT